MKKAALVAEEKCSTLEAIAKRAIEERSDLNLDEISFPDLKTKYADLVLKEKELQTEVEGL